MARQRTQDQWIEAALAAHAALDHISTVAATLSRCRR